MICSGTDGMIIEMKGTVNATCLDHPETTLHPILRKKLSSRKLVTGAKEPRECRCQSRNRSTDLKFRNNFRNSGVQKFESEYRNLQVSSELQKGVQQFRDASKVLDHPWRLWCYLTSVASSNMHWLEVCLSLWGVYAYVCAYSLQSCPTLWDPPPHPGL